MSALEPVREAVDTNIAGFHPTSGKELDEFVADLPGIISHFGDALSQAAEGMTDEHIHPAFIDSLRELGSTFAGVADSARETYDTHAREQGDFWLDK